MHKTAVAVLHLVALVVLATAGAGSVRAADDTLGASVEATIYADQDRVVSVLNRSTVDARFTFEAHDGWQVTPAALVLAPQEPGEVRITQVGSRASDLLVRIDSLAPTPAGEQRADVALTSHLLLEHPFDWVPLVIGGVVLLLLTTGGAFTIWRRGHRLAYLRLRRRIGC
jgi:hypothetical protein